MQSHLAIVIVFAVMSFHCLCLCNCLFVAFSLSLPLYVIVFSLSLQKWAKQAVECFLSAAFWEITRSTGEPLSHSLESKISTKLNSTISGSTISGSTITKILFGIVQIICKLIFTKLENHWATRWRAKYQPNWIVQFLVVQFLVVLLQKYYLV